MGNRRRLLNGPPLLRRTWICTVKLDLPGYNSTNGVIKLGNEIESRELARTKEQLRQALSILKRVDWFLRWLEETEPDATLGWICNEWTRGDPPCTGTRYRDLLRSIEDESAQQSVLSEV